MADRELIADFETAFNKEAERKAENWSPPYRHKDKGYYAEKLERYFNLFSKENIKVLLVEYLVKNPIKAIQKVLNF